MENLPPRESIDRNTHPVVLKKYTIVTPMMERVMGQVVTWITSGISGGFIEGDKRLGKTKTRRLLVHALPAYIPRIQTFSMVARRYIVPSESVFFSNLLAAFRNKLHDVGRSAQRRDRLTNHIATIAASSGQPRVVLFIDQAHWLHEVQYEWLIDVQEELDERGVDLFIFLVGQKELSTIAQEFRRRNKTQITGRFMQCRLEIRGIKKPGEMKKCLRSYDELSKYPDNTAWTYTRYFAPEAFERGWRLHNYAEQFWKAFDDWNRALVGSRKIEIYMQHFTRTVELCLTRPLTASGEPDMRYETLLRYVSQTAVESPNYESSEDLDEDERQD